MEKKTVSEFPFWWRLSLAWIYLPLIPFGLTTFVSFAYLAQLLKKKILWLFAVLYTLPALVGLLYVAPNGGQTDMKSFLTGLIFDLVLIGWLFSIVHCGFLWKEYKMARKKQRREKIQALAAQKVLH